MIAVPWPCSYNFVSFRTTRKVWAVPTRATGGLRKSATIETWTKVWHRAIAAARNIVRARSTRGC